MTRKKSLDELFFKYSLLTLLMFISALNFNIFISKINLVAGGSNGIAIILNKCFNFEHSIVILVVSVTVLILALVFKEKLLFSTALYASLIYPLFVDLTSNVGTAFNYDDKLVVTLFASIIAGIVSGITSKLGTSQGGIILISQVLSKKIKISVSALNTILNLIIVFIGAYVFKSIDYAMYAIIYLYVNKIIMDKIILGISQKKMFYIMTSCEEEVKKYIIEELNAGYTLLSATGGFKNKKKSVIMTTIQTRDYFKLKEGIKLIDKDAFFIVTDSYQVLGGK